MLCRLLLSTTRFLEIKVESFLLLLLLLVIICRFVAIHVEKIHFIVLLLILVWTIIIWLLISRELLKTICQTKVKLSTILLLRWLRLSRFLYLCLLSCFLSFSFLLTQFQCHLHIFVKLTHRFIGFWCHCIWLLLPYFLSLCGWIWCIIDFLSETFDFIWIMFRLVLPIKLLFCLHSVVCMWKRFVINTEFILLTMLNTDNWVLLNRELVLEYTFQVFGLECNFAIYD